MPAGFTKGETNAKAIGDRFTVAGVKVGTLVIVTAGTTVAVAHGLAAAPTFVLWSSSLEQAADNIVWTATTTTLTFTSTNTDASDTISYLAAVLQT